MIFLEFIITKLLAYENKEIDFADNYLKNHAIESIILIISVYQVLLACISTQSL